MNMFSHVLLLGFFDPVFEKEDLMKGLRLYGLLHCHKQLFGGFLRSVENDCSQNLS